MNRIALSCSVALTLFVAACSAPNDGPDGDPEQDDQGELRRDAPASGGGATIADRPATAGPQTAAGPYDAKLNGRGKPQPQPWRNPTDPVPTNPTPDNPGSDESGSGPKASK